MLYYYCTFFFGGGCAREYYREQMSAGIWLGGPVTLLPWMELRPCTWELLWVLGLGYKIGSLIWGWTWLWSWSYAGGLDCWGLVLYMRVVLTEGGLMHEGGPGWHWSYEGGLACNAALIMTVVLALTLVLYKKVVWLWGCSGQDGQGYEADPYLRRLCLGSAGGLAYKDAQSCSGCCSC